MLGSVFSSYYAWSGRGEPMNHCAVNVALYSRRGNRWAMTERGKRDVFVSERALAIGPSHMRWDGGALTIEIDETTCPLPSRIKGMVRLTPAAMTRQAFTLDDRGQHHWWPIAPEAHIEVSMTRPGVQWAGQGYFDMNRGSAPLEAAFRNWSWSYARLEDRAVLFYDTEQKDGAARRIAASIDATGQITPLEPPPVARLPRTRWMMRRVTRADPGHTPRVLRSLEDTPFYARSIVATRIFGETAVGMHEQLNLDRLAHPLVRVMIPFRNPRSWR